MSGMVDAIVAAWQAGYTLYHPVLAKVMSVKKYTPQAQGQDAQRGLLQATVGPASPDQPKPDDIEFLAPGKPAIGARFVLMRFDNLDGRKVGIGFTKFDEIKTVIGQAVEIEINDQNAYLRKGAMELKMDFNGNVASVKNGSNEFKSDSTEWTVTGPVKFLDEATFQKKITANDEIEASKKITSNDDVIASGKSLKTHIHPYTDTPVGPSFTEMPK